AEKGYTCPECRRGFERCPDLEKNVTLCNVVELARDGEARVSGTEKCEVAHGELCPQHGRPLELYCEDERRCICCICTVRQCQRHRRVLFEEERSKKQALLKESLDKAQEESERIERAMQELEEQTRSIKDSSERLKSVILSKFALLREALEDCQWRMVARIEQEQAAALGRVGEDWSLLKDRLDILGQHRERAQCLLACPKPSSSLVHGCLCICPQEFPLLPSPGSLEALLPVEFDVASMVKPITEILTDLSRLLLEDLPGSVAHKASDPIGQASSMPLLFPDHRNLTFDPETANKYLELSKGNRKAKHSPGAVCRQQEQGPRFEPWQVLCTQGYGHG
ncbi:Tripartite motif-containing protein 65, partial [Gavia stellata]